MKSLTQKLTLKLLVYPLVTLASITASGLALADDPTPDNLVTANYTPTRSRAEVIAEFYQARANGGMKVWSTSYNPFAASKSLLTRAEVKADAALLATVTPMAGEDSGSFVLSRMPQHRAAPRVLAASGSTNLQQ